MMYERRKGFRVKGDGIACKVKGKNVAVSDISITGAKLILPKGLKSLTPIANCSLLINYLDLNLPFKVVAKNANEARIEFFNVSDSHQGQLLKALKVQHKKYA